MNRVRGSGNRIRSSGSASAMMSQHYQKTIPRKREAHGFIPMMVPCALVTSSVYL
jgi:hypothetical protein